MSFLLPIVRQTFFRTTIRTTTSSVNRIAPNTIVTAVQSNIRTFTMHKAPTAKLEQPVKNVAIHPVRDPGTLSNYNNWRTVHITTNFEVQFEKNRLSGNVVLRMKSLSGEESKEVKLDSSYVDISTITIDGEEANYEVGDRIEPFGSPLTIKLNKAVPAETEINIDIALNTTDKCTALQWLTPEQTSNKKHPYMFSQCQPNHARSIFPCQDTPDVKATVDFNIKSPSPVLASGLPAGVQIESLHGMKMYKFRQTVPIPSYLFAILSGDIDSAKIGENSAVWTGPDELEGCKWEFEEDMDKFLAAAQKFTIPYQWGQYNVAVLPPSFPFGGMENPQYTFATPTIVSKDRQNVDVIAHELAHSWSGNLVTSASWEHFWLNEGWTVYLERRIGAEIHGEPQRGFSSIIGWKALSDSIALFGEDHEYTKLIVDLKGKDPDDAFSSVPYEKGFVFLYHLEGLVGKEKWDTFIPHYFTTFARKSLDSYEFKDCLLKFFESDPEAGKKLTDLDWDTWFYKPGFPPKPNFDDSMVKVCYKLADEWKANMQSGSSGAFEPKPEDIKEWNSQQSVVFLEAVQDYKAPLTTESVEKMGKAYGYAETHNVELLSRFYIVALKAKTESMYKPTAKLLGEVGRMKFVRPLYRALNGVDRDLAVKTFEEHRGFYHPITRGMVEKDLFGEK